MKPYWNRLLLQGGLLLLTAFGGSCVDLHAAYGDYSPTRPAWLDQSQTSANGDFNVWYVDNTRHVLHYGGGDADGDGLPDPWEIHYWGNTNNAATTDPDLDNNNNLLEFQAGSWPQDNFFRAADTIDPAVNPTGENRIVRDVIDTLVFCQGKYASWGFNAPWGLPLGVFIRNTYAGGWGNVNPLWCSPYLVSDLTDSDRYGVSIHELFHNVQRAYPDIPRDSDWLVEGSARMSQDFFFADQDVNFGANYAGEIEGFLSNPESQNLFERSYNAVFFWRYLVEQTGGSIVGQPWERFDAMHNFMISAKGKEGKESVQKFLNDLPPGHAWHGREASHFFAAWVTALYTRQFNAASLSSTYYYKDEQESLPASLLRPVHITNCVYNPATGAYAPEAVAANGSRYYQDADKTTWTQKLGKWRSRYYAFRPAPASRFFVIWVDGKAGQHNYYAVAGSRGRQVTHLSHNFGEDFQQALLCQGMDEIGVVVAALDNQADYDLMVWGITEFGLNILRPRTSSQATVRLLDSTPPAPVEIRVQVRVQKDAGPSGDFYAHGLLPELFEVWIGGIQATVLTGHELGNEYWLVVQPPELAVNNDYDLTVKLLDQQDTEIKAVRYEDRPHLDRMIVIDRSGSMGSELMGNNEKMLAAKSGGRLYTDLMVNDDMLGLASFGGNLDGVENDATLHNELDIVTAGFKATIKDRINSSIPDDPSQYEHTAMGQGMRLGYQQITTRGKAEHDWSMALLTDGIEDVNPLWGATNVSGVIIPSKIQVDAIALGNGAHEYLLNQIALDTEGTYYHVSIPSGTLPAMAYAAAVGINPVIENDVANVFRMINEKEMGYNRLWSKSGIVADDPVKIAFRVYEGMRDLLLTVNWPSIDSIKIRLEDPKGQEVAATVLDKSHALYRIAVLPGTWTLGLEAGSNVPFLAILTGRGDISSTLFFTEPDYNVYRGAIEKIAMSLVTPKGPVAGALVKARVTSPSGQVSILQLFDNGDHGDLAAGDGIYSRDYRLTPWVGSYQVLAVAEGHLDKESYQIEENGFFIRKNPVEGGDRDKDGMPDDWELRYGLDPNKYDADLDLDEDGLENLREFMSGGNPADPDTDHGGTEDGSEMKADLDMLEFSDDLIAPPTAFYANRQPVDAYNEELIIPGSGQVALYWSRGAEYAFVNLYRSLAESGPYTLIASQVPAEKRPFLDKGLVNGTPYYYRISAETPNGIRTHKSDPIRVVPRAQNLAPWGSLHSFNNKMTLSSNITLQLTSTPGTKEMRLANEAGFAGAAWTPFLDQVSWNIAGKPGINRIFVQFRDSEQNESLVFSTAVEYQEDTDGDLLGDIWERQYFHDLSRSGRDDSDGDGLANRAEFLAKSNPANSDTDRDGMLDGWEYQYEFNLLVNDAAADADHDGVSNQAEYISGTDPLDAKSQLDITMTKTTTGELVLTWPSLTGRVYSIYVNGSLTEGEWRKLPEFSNQMGTGRPMSYTHRISEKVEYLRLGVQMGRVIFPPIPR